MRRLGGILLVLAMVGSGAGAAPLDDTWSPSPGGWQSGPVEYVDSVWFEVGTAGGLDLRGDLLVATSWTGFSLYDVAEPLAPVHLHTEPLGLHFINERPQIGDGWLAINDDVSATLGIWDITDPTAPHQLAAFRWPDSRRHHQWTCVADCAFLYSNAGAIVSMADPSAPEMVGDWYTVLDRAPRDTHGIAEVAPGIVLTGTLPVHLLDAREDGAAPKLVITNDVPTTSAGDGYLILGPPPESFAADLAWPLDGSGDYALISKETPFSGACTEESGEVLTLDMTAALDPEAPSMPVVASYQITENGLPSEGLAPANVIGCSPYVIGVHPGHDDSGWVAIAFMEHGVRLLEVADDGSLGDVGGFIGHGGAAAAPLWVSDEVLYLLDFTRGIDILRVQR